MHPAHLTQIFLIYKEEHNYEEKDKISAQDNHYTESVEVQRNIRNQLIHIFNISVSEVWHILLQNLIGNSGIFLVPGALRCTISSQRSDSGLTPLYLFGCRQSSRTVFQLIAAFDNIGNSGDIPVHIPLGKERKHTGYLNPEQERVFPIIVSLLFGVQHSYSHQTYIGSSFIKSLYSRQFHRLGLCNLIAGTIARPYSQQ